MISIQPYNSSTMDKGIRSCKMTNKYEATKDTILKQVDEVFVSLGYLILFKADWNKSFFSKKAERIFRPSKPVMGNKLKIPVRRFTRAIIYIMNGLKKCVRTMPIKIPYKRKFISIPAAWICI